jgi:hypothetical protein
LIFEIPDVADIKNIEGPCDHFFVQKLYMTSPYTKRSLDL